MKYTLYAVTDFIYTLRFSFVLVTFYLNKIFFNRYQLSSNFSGNCKKERKEAFSYLPSYSHTFTPFIHSIVLERSLSITSGVWGFVHGRILLMVCDTDFGDIFVSILNNVSVCGYL